MLLDNLLVFGLDAERSPVFLLRQHAKDEEAFSGPVLYLLPPSQFKESLAVIVGKEHVPLFQPLLSVLFADELTSLAHVAAKTHDSDHVLTVACTFCRLDERTKLECLGVLMSILTPLEAQWQLQQAILIDTLRFICDEEYEWEYMDHSEALLLWELRAMCLCQMRRCREMSLIARGGDVAVEAISTGAKVIESSLLSSVPIIFNVIDAAGDVVKRVIGPGETPLLDERAEIVALAYTDAAKRYTDGARETTKNAVRGIRNASTHGITIVTRNFQEGKVGEKLVPFRQGRDTIAAVGKVGIASLGAVAVVGEAVVETTKAVALKTASVTADVVQYRYGDSAGQVVRDASDTAGNVLRTVAYVAMFQGKVLTKLAAKDAGKNQLSQARTRREVVDAVGSRVDRLVSITLMHETSWDEETVISISETESFCSNQTDIGCQVLSLVAGD